MLRRILAASAVSLLLGAGWIAYGSRDLPAVDDTDLRVERPPIEPEENLLTHLDRVLAGLGWSDEEDAVARGLLASEPFEAQRAAAFVARQLVGLEALPQALETKRFQLPGQPLADATEGPTGLRYQRLARALALRARHRAGRGEPEAALADALTILQVGQRLETARGAALIDGMFARAIKRIGLKAVETGARDLDGPRVRDLSRRLDAFRSDREAWAAMWAVEYEWLRRELRRSLAEADPGAPWWVPESYVFHPNRTLQRMAGSYRALRARARSGSCAATHEPPHAGELRKRLPLRLVPNSTGELALAEWRTAVSRLDADRCLLDVSISATQARLALWAWRREHGHLPETLEALVPGLLESVPVDAFDGRPLRYDREAALLWSVGSDARDAGGRRAEDEREILEPSFPI